MNSPTPYKSTPDFDQHTVPAGLRREHRTKVGFWGFIRVLEGQLRYRVLDPAAETIIDADHPGVVLPDQPHLVEPLGAMRMRVDFYRSRSPLAGTRVRELATGQLLNPFAINVDLGAYWLTRLASRPMSEGMVKFKDWLIGITVTSSREQFILD